jgi:transposase-like protein
MKQSIVLDIVNNDRSVSDVSVKTGIDVKTLYAWRRKHQLKVSGGGSDDATFQVGAGHPPLVNDAALQALGARMRNTTALIDKGLRVVGALKNIAQNKALLEAVNSTATADGDAGLTTSIDRRTASVILKKAQASANPLAPRLLNPSRMSAVSDPRGPITHAVMCKGLCYGRPPQLILNSDATHFLIESDDKRTKVLFVKQGEGDEPRMASTANALNWALKYILTIHAGGAAAPGVFVLSDPLLSPEDMKMRKVKLLSHDPSASAFGYLVYLQRRSGNTKFWKWFMKELVLPFIAGIKAGLFGDDVEVGDDEDGQCPILHSKVAVYSSDGEAGQVFNITKDPEMCKLLDDGGIVCPKLNPSRSLFEQGADLARVFSNTKGQLRNASGGDVFNPRLRDFIVAALKELKAEGVNIDPAQMERVATGLMCVVDALVNHCTAHNIKQGFVKSGMVGPPETWDDVTLRVPFGRHGVENGQNTPYYKFTSDDWRKINEHFDDMVERFLMEGTLTDEYLDSLGMPRAEGQTQDKDQLVVYRWRTTILNNPSVLQVLRDRAKKKAEEEAAALMKRQAALVLKNQKVLTAVMEKTFKELVDRLVEYRDQAATSLSECTNSLKEAKTRSSMGQSSCQVQKDNAKAESEKAHGLWRGAFDGKKAMRHSCHRW